MNLYSKYVFIVCICLLSFLSFSQNENTKWYFGAYAGLDFMSGPPSVLTNGQMLANEGCASIADGAGNFLFYVHGSIVWDKTHQIMANGIGLSGDHNATQASLIIKKPGSGSLYYIFTQNTYGTALEYSIVDMSLAAGMGSVTIKNAPLANTDETEKLTGTIHCNGVDYWIVSHSNSTNQFRSYLLTSSGVSNVPVLSYAGTSFVGFPTLSSLGMEGAMKMSPNGKKLGTALYTYQSNLSTSFELFDFDNTTGIVSNPLVLMSGLTGAYGCEFSGDGTKFYGCGWAGDYIYQWDLCAGSGPAIVSSLYSHPCASGVNLGNMQLGPDGKIYVARVWEQFLGVIDSPNIAGAGCNYIDFGQSIAPSNNLMSLPNNLNCLFIPHPTPQPFTYTVSNNYGCQGVAFNTPPANANLTLTACSINGYSITNVQWNFGDPLTGASNTSTLNNPVHNFSSQGVFTVQVILYNSCGGGTDTLIQLININQSCLAVNVTTTCALGSATVIATSGIGPFTYTWMPAAQTTSVISGIGIGVQTVSVFDQGTGFTYTALAVFNSGPFTNTVVASTSLTCYGAYNGTATVMDPVAGSGSLGFSWYNGSLTYTAPFPNSLSAGTWTLTLTDLVNGCQFQESFTISQPASPGLSITASTFSICTGGSVTLLASNTGTNPVYSYTWSSGPVGAGYTVSPATNGIYIYTVNSTDGSNCLSTATISLNFVANPIISLNSVSICPGQAGTLTASGAATYSWNTNVAGNSLIDNPLITTDYTVTGTAMGCVSTATASIFLNTVPSPILTNNSPLCEGSSLTFSASGGASYQWSGPLSFTSSVPSPTISQVLVANAGVYETTVTAANSCTATTSATVIIYPTPTLSILGSTVCVGETFSLSASSFTGSTYLWAGPLNFSSSSQNTTVANSTMGMTGNYTLLATSIENCTNQAIATVSVVAAPVLTVALSSNSLCAQAFGGSPNSITLTPSGANAYTLTTTGHFSNANSTGSIFPLYCLPPYQNVLTISTTTLQGSNGVCVATSLTNFSIYPNPIISVTAANPVICTGQSYTYTNSGADSYTWTLPGQTNTINTLPSIVFNRTVTSVFSIVGERMGCRSSTVLSTLSVNPLPTITLSGNTKICFGSFTTLMASGSMAGYTWTPSVNGTTASTLAVSPQNDQVYFVTGSSNNCTNTAAITVTVLPLPTVSISASRTEVCVNESFTLTGTEGNYYFWKDPKQKSYSGPTLVIKALSPDYSGSYTLRVSDINGCQNSDTKTILVHALPTGTLVGKKDGCIPFCPLHTFIPNSSSVKAVWTYSLQSLAANNPNFCYKTIGNHYINGLFYDTVSTCINNVTFSVSTQSKPLALFDYYPESPVEKTDEVLFTSTSQGTQITNTNWYFMSNAGYTSSAKNPSYVFENYGTYPVALVVTNAWGCSDTLVKSITIEQGFNVYVPNAFTPNDDGRNDVFLATGYGIKDFQMEVFDRWGVRVFESNDLLIGWDGEFAGKPAKMESYIWKVIATNQKGDVKTLTGQVILYR